MVITAKLVHSFITPQFCILRLHFDEYHPVPAKHIKKVHFHKCGMCKEVFSEKLFLESHIKKTHFKTFVVFHRQKV